MKPGRSGSRHRVFAEFVEAEGEPGREEMDALLDYVFRFFLSREPDEAERPVAESSEPLLVRDARPGRLPRLLTWLAERAPGEVVEELGGRVGLDLGEGLLQHALHFARREARLADDLAQPRQRQ